ncbi:MAG: Rrf2 family transcriptional regulator, partial [Alphaproteobacteria bacterium]|nr:Rrf2 family transcriptional regulator [Alphaproteobacteria bacterium]
GVVLMARLAREGDRSRSADSVLTAGQLSSESGVPLPTVAKILKQLTAAGLVVSQRGAGGGYALSRSAEAITAADIIGVLEGPVLLTACVDGSGDECGVEALCPMRGNWNKVNEAVRHALEEVSLADMAAPVLPFLAPNGPQASLDGTA